MIEKFFKIFKWKQTKKTKLRYTHDELGIFENSSEDIWVGNTSYANSHVEIAVSGDSKGPNEKLINQLCSVLNNSNYNFKESALNFLLLELKDKVPLNKNDFEIQSFDFLWPDKIEYFVATFSLKEDEDAVWRVEFYNNEPKFLSRDG